MIEVHSPHQFFGEPEENQNIASCLRKLSRNLVETDPSSFVSQIVEKLSIPVSKKILHWHDVTNSLITGQQTERANVSSYCGKFFNEVLNLKRVVSFVFAYEKVSRHL